VVTEKAVCNDQRRLTACGCLGAAKKQQARMGTVNNGCLWPLLHGTITQAWTLREQALSQAIIGTHQNVKWVGIRLLSDCIGKFSSKRSDTNAMLWHWWTRVSHLISFIDRDFWVNLLVL
jgi:hypothetical protein